MSKFVVQQVEGLSVMLQYLAYYIISPPSERTCRAHILTTETKSISSNGLASMTTQRSKRPPETKKLSYRKDDRAMTLRVSEIYVRKISGVPDYAHGYFSRIFYGLFFRLMQ